MEKSCAPAPRPADNEAYSPEPDFDAKEIGDGGVITRYVGEGGDVVVPPVIRGKRVVGISGEERRQGLMLFPGWIGAFEYCRELKSVDLPEGLTTLGYNCFGRNHERPVYQVYRGSSAEAYVKKNGFRYEATD